MKMHHACGLGENGRIFLRSACKKAETSTGFSVFHSGGTLRRTAGADEIPVIFLTGVESVEAEIESYVSGAADFIQKPVNGDLLRLKIRRQLYIRDLKEQNHLLQEKLQRVKTGLDRIVDEMM